MAELKVSQGRGQFRHRTYPNESLSDWHERHGQMT